MLLLPDVTNLKSNNFTYVHVTFDSQQMALRQGFAMSNHFRCVLSCITYNSLVLEKLPPLHSTLEFDSDEQVDNRLLRNTFIIVYLFYSIRCAIRLPQYTMHISFIVSYIAYGVTLHTGDKHLTASPNHGAESDRSWHRSLYLIFSIADRVYCLNYRWLIGLIAYIHDFDRIYCRRT